MTEKVVKSKTILITGANRGIGLETARQLASQGHQVIVTARQKAAAERIISDLVSEGHKVEFIQLDVSDTKSIKAAGEKFGETLETLDVLINNAGIYPDKGYDILTISQQQLSETFQTNTFGPIAVTQAFLPFLKKSGKGRVINISSGYGQICGLAADVPSYCLSKLALNGATIMLAQALKPFGIAVNAMCPGWVRSDMGGPNASRSLDEGADTVVWLATEAKSTLTGKFFRDRKELDW